MKWRHQDRDRYDEHKRKAIIPSMTAGKLIKFNMPKLFSELQLIALFAAGVTRKNTTIKEITLKEAFINNLTINE
jgi:hypothetical protein